MREPKGIVLPPDLLPGSPAALRLLARGIEEAGREGLRLEEAWMLDALPWLRPRLAELARRGRLLVGPDWSRLDSHAPVAFREGSLLLARACLQAWEGVRVLEDPPGETEDAESHAGRAGLCLEARWLSDCLSLEGMAEAEVLPLLEGLLPALAPAALGGLGPLHAQQWALARLRALFSLHGRIEEAFTLPEAETLPRRVSARTLETRDLQLGWSRSKGLSWTGRGIRRVQGLFNLEIQGEASDPLREPFRPDRPEGRRIFEVAHMKPNLHVSREEGEWMGFSREFKLPLDPASPKGRLSRVGWELGLFLDRRRGGLKAQLRLTSLPPGQRVRLLLPVPFYPRPARLKQCLPSGRLREEEREGPFGPLPVQGEVELCCREGRLGIRGPGIREIEVLPGRNRFWLALTLIRTFEGGPSSILRAYELGWRT